MIIVCKNHDRSIIGSRDTEGGGPRSTPPPQSQIDQKSLVWIGLNYHFYLQQGKKTNKKIYILSMYNAE